MTQIPTNLRVHPLGLMSTKTYKKMVGQSNLCQQLQETNRFLILRLLREKTK